MNILKGFSTIKDIRKKTFEPQGRPERAKPLSGSSDHEKGFASQRLERDIAPQEHSKKIDLTPQE